MHFLIVFHLSFRVCLNCRLTFGARVLHVRQTRQFSPFSSFGLPLCLFLSLFSLLTFTLSDPLSSLTLTSNLSPSTIRARPHQHTDFYTALENAERLRLEAMELEEMFAELDAETAAKKGKQ
jgi:hypothetical protein